MFGLKDAANEYDEEEDEDSGMLTTRQFDLDKLMSTQLSFDDGDDESPHEISNITNYYASNGREVKKFQEDIVVKPVPVMHEEASFYD